MIIHELKSDCFWTAGRKEGFRFYFIRRKSGKIEKVEFELFDCEAVSYDLKKFMQIVEMNKSDGGISTGFDSLDELLDKWLYPGLKVKVQSEKARYNVYIISLYNNFI